jgi:hypothetical protein
MFTDIVVRNTTMNNRKFHIRAAVALSDFTLLMQRFSTGTQERTAPSAEVTLLKHQVRYCGPG